VQWKDERLLRNWLPVIVRYLQQRSRTSAYFDSVKPHQYLDLDQNGFVNGTFCDWREGQGHYQCSLWQPVWSVASGNDLLRWEVWRLLLTVLVLW